MAFSRVRPITVVNSSRSFASWEMPYTNYITQRDPRNSWMISLSKFLWKNPITRPLCQMHYNAVMSRLNKFGLRRDDLFGDSELYDVALERVPKAEADAHLRRIVRALDAQTKHEKLPASCGKENEGHHNWLTPYMDQVTKEMQEAEAYDRHHKY